VETADLEQDVEDNRFSRFLELSHIQLPSMSKCALEPRINYHKSLLLNEENHVKKLEDLAAKREEAAAEKGKWCLEKEARKEMKLQQRKEKK